jgi:3-hydroxypropanoate dehydrogenase
MRLHDAALDTLFRKARSYNRWSPAPVPEATLRELYELLKLGPTSANCSPARFVFVVREEAKAKLLECVSAGNHIKVQQAPVTVIIGMDERFYDKLGFLFPHAPAARTWFQDPAVAHATTLRNSSLQGAYLIAAARSLGLDCGPMSGIDNSRLDAAFFAGTSVKSNFICSLGHGNPENLHERLPRLSFEEACSIL